jgi:wyosine [tRNA(Phe)-imidazoG37] synthetase (radical SAM superfamily)
VVLPSLDAVSPEVFERINRPGPGFSIENVIQGLIEFLKVYQGQIWLEILFCKGINDTPEELQEMKKAIDRIMPDQIHLNSVVRPPSERWVTPLTQEELERIRAFFGERASLISEFDRHILPPPELDVTERILSILRRRPLSLSDLSRTMGLSQYELERLLKPLVKEGEVRSQLFSGFRLLQAVPAVVL